MTNSSVHLPILPLSILFYLFYSISCTQGFAWASTQNPVLGYCCYAGLYLFLPNFLLDVPVCTILGQSGTSSTQPVRVRLDPYRDILSGQLSFQTHLFNHRSPTNVSFWCHVSLSRPPSLSPSIPHPDVHIRVSGNTECTCCRLIGASVHADSCPRSKRRLNEGTVLFVLMVNSSQIIVLRRQFSLKIN